jgi:hypothetical protein
MHLMLQYLDAGSAFWLDGLLGDAAWHPAVSCFPSSTPLEIGLGISFGNGNSILTTSIVGTGIDGPRAIIGLLRTSTGGNRNSLPHSSATA